MSESYCPRGVQDMSDDLTDRLRMWLPRPDQEVAASLLHDELREAIGELERLRVDNQRLEEERLAILRAYFNVRQWCRDEFGTASLSMPDPMEEFWFPGIFTEDETAVAAALAGGSASEESAPIYCEDDGDGFCVRCRDSSPIAPMGERVCRAASEESD